MRILMQQLTATVCMGCAKVKFFNIYILAM
jgi:hypothetical protein